MDSSDENLCSAGAAWKWRAGRSCRPGKASWFLRLSRLTLCSGSGLVWAEPAGRGWAKGAGSQAPRDGQGSSDREDSRSWTVVSATCCWAGDGGSGEGLGSEDGSRAELQAWEEHRVWLLSLWAPVAELPVEQDVLSEAEAELTQAPWLRSFRGASPEKRSEEMWGRWMSMAAVVTTHTAGSGTPLSAERRVL